jgi:hypothetical protein
MLRSIILSRSEFLSKLITKEFDFVPYATGGCGKNFSVPTYGFELNDIIYTMDEVPIDGEKAKSPPIKERLLMEITTYSDDIKLTYYLPVDIPIDTNLYSYSYKKYHLCEHTIRFDAPLLKNGLHYVIPEEITLYYLMYLEDWKAVFKRSYDKIVEAIKINPNTLTLTYGDIRENCFGRNGDIDRNLDIGINRLLIDMNKAVNFDDYDNFDDEIEICGRTTFYCESSNESDSE